MIRLKGVFRTQHEPGLPDDSLSWDFITPVTFSHWDNSGFDFFIDKVFDELAPGESRIRSRDFPARIVGPHSYIYSQTYQLPRRYEVYGIPGSRRPSPPEPTNFQVQASMSDMDILEMYILQREG